MISSSIQKLLAPLLHSSFLLWDQYVGLKVNHGEDQVNLKSKWAPKAGSVLWLRYCSFLWWILMCPAQQPRPHVTVHWHKICMTSISSSGPASHQCKWTAAAWQPLFGHIFDCLTQSRKRRIKSSQKKKKTNKKNQKRVLGENYNRNVNYTFLIFFFFFCISIKNDGVKSIKGIRVGN